MSTITRDDLEQIAAQPRVILTAAPDTIMRPAQLPVGPRGAGSTTTPRLSGSRPPASERETTRGAVRRRGSCSAATSRDRLSCDCPRSRQRPMATVNPRSRSWALMSTASASRFVLPRSSGATCLR